MIGGNLNTVSAALRKVAREGTWKEVLHQQPLENKVFWTVDDDDIITLYYRIEEVV